MSPRAPDAALGSPRAARASGRHARRGGLDIVGDAIDRLRSDWVAVTLLHVLPSVPFFVALLDAAVAIDLRGGLPPEGLGAVAALYLLKIAGWGALAAWCSSSARARRIGPGAAWRRTLTRLPEIALGGALAVTGFVLLLVPSAPGLGVLAAAAADDRPGGWAAVKRGFGAATSDLDRCFAILMTAAFAWLLVSINLLVLFPIAVALGAGGLGLDVSVAGTSFNLDRYATWAFCGATAALVVEAFLVAAFAELDADREAEREGVRFEQFADELDARDAQPVARTPVAHTGVARTAAVRGVA